MIVAIFIISKAYSIDRKTIKIITIGSDSGFTNSGIRMTILQCGNMGIHTSAGERTRDWDGEIDFIGDGGVGGGGIPSEE